MADIPHDNRLDSTLAMLSDPYRYVSTQSKSQKSDIFKARLLLQDTICMTGAEAAALFYDDDYFIRDGAMPNWIQQTLLGVDGIQGMDNAAHTHRKQMFMSLLMEPAEIERLVQIANHHWRDYARKWALMDRVVLYNEVQEILCRAVCKWAGVPLAESEVKQRTRELSALYDYAGNVGPKHWWARLARRRANNWAQQLIEHTRENPQGAAEASILHTMAHHRDKSGNLLDTHTAATELLNVLRPTVAVSVFIMFVAHALHQHSVVRHKLAAIQDDYITHFIQEVRRFYPFFPVVAARVRKDFEHRGCPFHKGTRVLLDLYGTNHSKATWEDPEIFRPERFIGWDGDLFNFIPQGGGNAFETHRCPGENVAIELMKAAITFLVNDITYTMPQQDLQIDYRRLPALPKSHIIISNVQTNF